jgi:hypothetical protein
MKLYALVTWCTMVGDLVCICLGEGGGGGEAKALRRLPKMAKSPQAQELSHE